MLEPREADLPALFLVLVVLPLVIYILLGKWSEAAKKEERISFLAQLAAEEAYREEEMVAASVIPVVSVPRTSVYQCARCFAPATTRCSQCKSVRYCSGKCQIFHWRQGHKQECQQLETSSPKPSLNSALTEGSVCERISFNDETNFHFAGYNIKKSLQKCVPSDKTNHHPIHSSVTPVSSSNASDKSRVSIMERKIQDKSDSCRSKNSKMLPRDNAILFGSSEEAYRSRALTSTLSNTCVSKDASMKHKVGNNSAVTSEEQISKKHIGPTAPKSRKRDVLKLRGQAGSQFESGRVSSIPSSFISVRNWTDACEIEMDSSLDRDNLLGDGLSPKGDRICSSDSPEMILGMGSMNPKSSLHQVENKASHLPRSMGNSVSEVEKKGQADNESKIPQMNASNARHAYSGSGVSTAGVMKMMGLKKLPKIPRQDAFGFITNNRKKNKVLFPYEEFVKFFQCEMWDFSPRGLLNCGNSCYANAVLQCLTCTKPLIIYLLQRSHSRTCSVKDWCLMCELEQHVMMLREGGGPLSPSGILSHMWNMDRQMGGGSQEDAHEFLRLLITSMQSICLEGLGGEKEVDSRLQETTFIQHTFGGHLRSKVKCMRCHHESERYENIMDLSLEILGWVESLEDALTQFTAPEDLDGENMYRCGRCAKYVKARKQLSIHEAPNILTIVLKRFQNGRYGKVDKYVTFPEMLDMIPFMTGNGDSPPLYMLYAVVVHLDTSNESFSGHYVSYVKDLQGTWFRIDDTEVRPVPMSHVMSEGAYILFYSRSYPRPPRECSGRASLFQAPALAKHCSRSQKPSRQGQTKPGGQCFDRENRNIPTVTEAYADSISTEFSDATSSDWSLFTSSDEASFTTESTRDSFSTVDYADTCNADPISSIFNTFYAQEYPSHSTVSCRSFSHSKPQTRFFSEKRGFVLDSSQSSKPFDIVKNGESLKQVSVSLAKDFLSVNNCSMSVKCGSNPSHNFVRTSGGCEL